MVEELFWYLPKNLHNTLPRLATCGSGKQATVFRACGTGFGDKLSPIIAVLPKSPFSAMTASWLLLSSLCINMNYYCSASSLSSFFVR